MIQITIPQGEMFDEVNKTFIETKEKTLALEHSLISLSKWEAKWHKPFLGSEKTREETIDYIKCMTMTPNVDPMVYNFITDKNLKEIADYINDSMTATWFSEDNNKPKKNNEVITNELIYYWMVTLQIPFECEKWHLNHLLTLIKVCSAKNAPPKKMSRKEILARNKELNEARRKALNSSG